VSFSPDLLTKWNTIASLPKLFSYLFLSWLAVLSRTLGFSSLEHFLLYHGIMIFCRFGCSRRWRATFPEEDEEASEHQVDIAA